MYQVNKFCGLSLRSASVIIGWLSAVISLSQSIICIVILAYINEIIILIANIFCKQFLDVEIIAPVICIVVSLKLGVSLLDLFASILVIIGTQRNSHLMLLPWLINNFVILVIRVPIHFISFVGVFTDSNIPIKYPILLFIVWGFHCYIWNAIYSHFEQIRESKDLLVSSDHQSLENNYELFNKSQKKGKPY